ncbi:MAG: MerR family transcriptional regulator [Hamadaea sp.]|nr:MerR family transcriptional regulator [Hamadaea sp.]
MSSRDTRREALTISEFARRSGLSHKALRLYDLSGLLAPAEVDPVNGYRLYSPGQLERARRISLLRQLDMPLATVAEVLDGDDEDASWRLERWWEEQESMMTARRDTVQFLRSQLSRTGEPRDRYAVGLREVPEVKVAAIRREVDQHDLVATMSASAREIREHLMAGGARATREEWWVFHGLVTPDSEAPVEVCVPFTGSVDPAGPIVIRVEPAHTQAYATVLKNQCSYPRIMLAYDAVGRWTRDHATPAGPPREVYFAAFEETGDLDPFAYVAQPVIL